MNCDVLGWPEDGPRLDLDHEVFAYAGKFVMSNTGKAIATDDDVVVAATAFNRDRTDPGETVWIRYVTVRRDRQGEGIAPRLIRYVCEEVMNREFERIRIAVNTPYLYVSLYRIGFGYTGRETGISELVMERPDPTNADIPAYRTGLESFFQQQLTDAQHEYVREKLESDGLPNPL